MITVGVPTYNRAAHLFHALSAILSQTFDDFELIVCDDGSTDDTNAVVASFSDDRIRYVRSPTNLRIPGVLNRILELANGDAIVMLHDHDRFAPDLLAEMMQVLTNHPSVGFVNPGVAWEDEDGGRYERMPSLPARIVPGSALVRQMLLGRTFACPITACALVRRSAYEAVGFRYDECFGFLADVDMWLRLAAVTDVGQADDVGLVCRRRDAAHAASGEEAKLAELVVAIHKANAERFFAGQSAELVRAQRTIRRKALRLFVEMLGSAAVQGDKRRVHETLRATAGTMDGLLALGARTLTVPLIEDGLIGLGSGADQVRRRLRSRWQ